MKCPDCENRVNHQSEIINLQEDDQTHIVMDCPAFSDLRELYNLEDDSGLAGVFQQVVARRLKIEDIVQT